MRLIVLQSLHGKTTTHRSGAGGTSPPSDPANARLGRLSPSHVRPAAGGPLRFAGANRAHPRSRTGHGASASDSVPARAPAERPAPQNLGRTPPRPVECRRREGLSDAVGRASQNGWGLGGLAAPGRVGPTAGPPRGGLGRVSLFGPARLAQGGARRAPPQSRSAGTSGLEKNCRKCWRTA